MLNLQVHHVTKEKYKTAGCKQILRYKNVHLKSEIQLQMPKVTVKILTTFF